MLSVTANCFSNLGACTQASPSGVTHTSVSLFLCRQQLFRRTPRFFNFSVLDRLDECLRPFEIAVSAAPASRRCACHTCVPASFAWTRARAQAWPSRLTVGAAAAWGAVVPRGLFLRKPRCCSLETHLQAEILCSRLVSLKFFT